jgi:hypothetical protein
MFDQLANTLVPDLFRTKRPHRIAQHRLTRAGYLDSHLPAPSVTHDKDAGLCFLSDREAV